MNPHYLAVALRANHRCEYGHAPEIIFNCRFEVEHIVPTSKDGPDELNNFAFACRFCNSQKSDQFFGTDSLFAQELPLYNPRKQNWKEHFQINLETWKIEGRTSIGRATISRLEMNAAFQVEARALWAKLGLFP